MTEGETRPVWSVLEPDEPAHRNWWIYDAAPDAEAHRQRRLELGRPVQVDQGVATYRELPFPHWQVDRPAVRRPHAL